MGFIDSLKNKSESEKKTIAIVLSGIVALSVAGIAIFSLISNLSKLDNEKKSQPNPIVIEKPSAWSQIKKTVVEIKTEVSSW